MRKCVQWPAVAVESQHIGYLPSPAAGVLTIWVCYPSCNVFFTRLLPQVDLVLLSHPDPSHIGALPYLVRKAGLKAPIYAAVPIAKLGMMFMYDSYTSLHVSSRSSSAPSASAVKVVHSIADAIHLQTNADCCCSALEAVLLQSTRISNTFMTNAGY